MRSAIRPILASLGAFVAAVALVPGAPALAADEPRVTVALLPKGTGLASLGSVEGLVPGLMSAGIGGVPAPQTYLDVTQGNRVSESLYDESLPRIRFGPTGVRQGAWEVIEQRAREAPAEVVPGLLVAAMARAGLDSAAGREADLGRLLAADRDGRIDALRPGGCRAECPALGVEEFTIAQLKGRVAALTEDELLIAIERPPPLFRTLAIGVAGGGLDGLLTSESTRTEGLVTSTDVAPTVLEHLGVKVPAQMNGQPIEAAGERDVAGLISLEKRLEVTGARRGPVVGETLLIWLALVGIAALARRAAGAATALRLLALALAYLPLVLLLTPALDPSLALERALAGVAPVLAAALTLRLAGPWRGLALACLLTVAGYAIDVVAGSILVPLSIPGPNPVSGSRFYGIGNEIEATVAALLPLGMGALLASLPSTRDGGRAAAAAFLAAGFGAAAAFALGRFGADVGAAIVLPAGAAVAAAVAIGTRRGLVVLVVPLLAIAALLGADTLLGGEAHLTRSVLDAGGFEQAADVFERRVRLAADSFTRGSNLPFLLLALIVIAVGVRERRRLRSWFPERSAWAGFLGAFGAAVVGTLSNDSGVVLLILGCAFCLAVAGYAWALRRPSRRTVWLR